jgi:hypothetical protein
MGYDDLYAEMKTGNFMILALRAVTLVSHYFTNKKSKMAVAGSGPCGTPPFIIKSYTKYI